ncbi:hypothetical protein BAUCODRAFT_558712 [Baudoinia panamericana UAMH 10762]|uniref:Uncharacterized protein n=1 Tax=Baudoinia panamericana (strain UAMH 10762) TaxID=717646 RepID=M2N7F4_BAUPA|nr:uncharacterized protein BAUCODRAFT_558712 [Baudoinia panamericana UAMH 10762]EMC94735.1 hypothetical protein BAUCODRAFT_558712 [Baudoinia panamericana UAMH 10762]
MSSSGPSQLTPVEEEELLSTLLSLTRYDSYFFSGGRLNCITRLLQHTPGHDNSAAARVRAPYHTLYGTRPDLELTIHVGFLLKACSGGRECILLTPDTQHLYYYCYLCLPASRRTVWLSG